MSLYSVKHTFKYISLFDFSDLKKGDLLSFSKLYYANEEYHDQLLKYIIKQDDLILFKSFIQKKDNSIFSADKKTLSIENISFISKQPESNLIFQYIQNHHKEEINAAFLFLITSPKTLKSEEFIKFILKNSEKKDIILEIEKFAIPGDYGLKTMSFTLLKHLRLNGYTFNDFKDETLLYLQYKRNKKISRYYKAVTKTNLSDFRNKEGENHLHYIIKQNINKSGYCVNEYSKDLLSKSNISLLMEYNLSGDTPLHIFLENKITSNIPEVMKFIYDNNININMPNRNNDTFYHLINKYPEAAFNFSCIMLGGDPTYLNNLNETPVSKLNNTIQYLSLNQFKDLFSLKSQTLIPDVSKKIKRL